MPKKGKTSDCFAMNGDYFNTCLYDYSDITDAYAHSLKKVELTLPCNYQKVIEKACDIGTHELKYKVRNYYVLIIVTAGVMDDFEESLKEISRAAGLPLSVILIRVGNT